MKNKSLRYFLVKNVLSLLNETFTLHGIRVAYIMLKMCEYENRPIDVNFMQLVETCIYHDIGAYKTEKVSEVFRLEEMNTFQHSSYGYLFLKHLSTLDEYSEIVLHHHLKYEKKQEYSFAFLDESIRVHLADRIDVAALNGNSDDQVIGMVKRLAGKWFDPADVDLFIKANQKYRILSHIRNEDFESEIIEFYSHFPYDLDAVIDILKMLVYSIDFRNEETVIHTVSSAVMAKMIGRYFGMSEEELRDLYFGALLHDIGKIAIPIEILESKNYLNHEEMLIMKGHIYETKKIIDGFVSENIVNIAVRHHERSNGSGYPLGLVDEELSLSEKIVAAADVVSALNEKRLYKGVKSKREVLKIINDMAKKNEFDPNVIRVINVHYDDIIKEIKKTSKGVLQKYENLRDDYMRLVQQSKRTHMRFGQELFADWGLFQELTYNKIQ